MANRRRNDVLIPTLIVLFDSVAIEYAFLLAYWVRFKTSLLSFLPLTAESVPPLDAYVYGSFVVIPVWLSIFQSRKMYSARRNVHPSDDLFTIAQLVTLGMLVVMSAAFFYRAFSYSRTVFGLLWIFSVAFLYAGRVILYKIEKRHYLSGRDLRHAVIIGSNQTANRVFAYLHNHPLLGYSVIGYLADRECLTTEPLGASRWIGRLDDVTAQIQSGEVELVLVAVNTEEHGKLAEIIRDCEGMNVEFMMVPDFLELMSSRMAVKEIEGIPFIRLKGVPMSSWGRISKRAFDLVASILLLIITAPFALLIAVAIKLGSKGPALFAQERIGLDGTRFRMMKFRSMRVGAEEFDAQAGLGIRDDPRITAVGRVLRRASLDELPQLLNVLKGEMSLVGPRPERPYYVDRFKKMVPKYLDRHRVKTGMTGWAQVNGFRGDSSLEERIKYDIYYIENWSLGFDVRILFRTISALFT